MLIFFKKIEGFFRKRSKRFLFAGIFLIGAALISLYFLLLLPTLQDIKKATASLYLEVALNAESEINGFLDENVNVLNDLARILAAVEKDQEKKGIIERFLKERKYFEEMSIINNQGQEILRVSKSLVFTQKDFRDLSWSDKFVKPREGKNYISLIYFSEKSIPFITISVPIKPSPQEISTVLSAELSLQEIWDIVQEIEARTGDQVYLVDYQGYLIAHPDISLALKKPNLLERKAVEDVILHQETVLGLEEKEQYINEKGEKVYVVGVPLKKMGWGVFVEKPFKEAWASYQRTRNLGLMSISASFILFLILFSITQALLRTFQDLEMARMALEEAKTVLEIKVKARTSELEELAGNLEEKVKERTKELQKKMEDLEKFQTLAIGRELKMITLKEEIKKLKKESKEEK